MIVDIKNLYKTYENSGKVYEVLKDINLEVNSGELLILEGVSGSGKSTLLSLIAGMEKPTSGKLEVLNEPIAKLPDIHISAFRAKKIGMIFQNFNLLESFSVIDNVMLPLANQNINLKDAKDLAIKALKNVNIENLEKKDVKYLSGGQKQRVAIARAIVNKPKLLLCDEPTANLDRANSINFIKLLKELNNSGLSAIVATHDPIFSEILSSAKVLKIEQGQIING